MNSPRIVSCIVTPQEAHFRLDCFLSERFTYCSRSQWQAHIQNGLVRLNGRPCRSARRLNANDVIACTLHLQTEEPPVDPQFSVVMEDEDLLVVSKSGNLPCHPAGAYFENTLWAYLRERYGNVHFLSRLDRETSGLTLCLKENAPRLREYTHLFEGDSVRKTYYALVFGAFTKTIRAKGFLSSDPESPVRKKRRFTVEHPPDAYDVQTCDTLLRPVAANARYSLVEAIPFTGRLHQIRATLCSLHFPLIGDKLYGPNDRFYLKFIQSQLSEYDKKTLLMERQALHAGALHFKNLRTFFPISLEISLPHDMLSFCETHSLNPTPADFVPFASGERL